MSSNIFLWCCPKKKKKQKAQSLQQSLIQKQSSQSIIRMTQQEKKPKVNQAQQNNLRRQKQKDQKIVEQQKNIQNIDNPKKYLEQQQIQKKKDKIIEQNIGIMPNFGKTEMTRPYSPREYEKNIPSLKKSHLWKQQVKSDLIYFNLTKNSYVYMSYRLTKNQETKEYLNGLDYFLSRTQDKIHVVIGKHSMINGKLPTISKHNQNTIIASYGKNIAEQNQIQAQMVIMEDLRCIRWTYVNSIVIILDSFLNFQQIRAYFNRLIKDLGWDQLRKATFLFPAFMTLQNISQLLFPCFKQYVMNSNLQKVSLDLVFDMQLIEGTKLDCCIIIKSRSEDTRQSNAIYDHLKLSIIFFAKDLSQLTQRVYRDFYIQSRQRSLKEYLDMKQSFKRNPSQFRAKGKQLKDLEPKVFSDILNSPSLKQFPCEDSGFYYVIQSKVRQDIGRIFDIAQLQKKEIDTPIKKQWDDDATADDFKTVKTIKTNKLDSIAKEQLDRIDLDMGLGDDDQQQQYLRNIQNHEEPQIIFKVQERKPNHQIEESPIIEIKAAKEREKKAESNSYNYMDNRCERNRRYDPY